MPRTYAEKLRDCRKVDERPHVQPDFFPIDDVYAEMNHAIKAQSTGIKIINDANTNIKKPFQAEVEQLAGQARVQGKNAKAVGGKLKQFVINANMRYVSLGQLKS